MSIPSRTARMLPAVAPSALVLAALAVGATAEHAVCHPARTHAPAAHTATARPRPPRARVARVARGMHVAGGRCSATGAFCVTDAMCGHGAVCEDPPEVAAVMAARGVTPRHDDPTPAVMTTLAANGTGYGCVWLALDEDRNDLWFARINAAGQRVGRPVRVTNTASVKVLPDLVWDGEGYGLVYTDITDARVTSYLLRLTAEGAPRGGPVQVAPDNNPALAARAVWNGREYAVAWYTADTSDAARVRFTRITPAGQRVGAVSQVHGTFLPGGSLGLAWAGDAYGVSFNSYVPRDDRSTTVFVRVGAGGEAAAPVTVSAGAGYNASVALAWNGRHFGAVWQDNLQAPDDGNPVGALAYAGVGPGGVVVPRKALTGRAALPLSPSLAWAGERYGLAWTVLSDDGIDAYVGRVTVEGGVAGTPLKLNGPAPGVLPTVAAQGTELGVAWTDTRRGDLDVYFARVSASGGRIGGDVQLTAP